MAPSSKSVTDMKILVTGTSGFIGCRLAQILTELDHEVVATGRSANSVETDRVRSLEKLGIRVIEGSGGGGSVKTIETKGAANLPGGVGGTRWYWYTLANMARVPVVGLGLGSVAGLGAAVRHDPRVWEREHPLHALARDHVSARARSRHPG